MGEIKGWISYKMKEFELEYEWYMCSLKMKKAQSETEIKAIQKEMSMIDKRLKEFHINKKIKEMEEDFTNEIEDN